MVGSNLPLKTYVYYFFPKQCFFFSLTISNTSNQQEIKKVTIAGEGKVASEISHNAIYFKHFLHF